MVSVYEQTTERRHAGRNARQERRDSSGARSIRRNTACSAFQISKESPILPAVARGIDAARIRASKGVRRPWMDVEPAPTSGEQVLRVPGDGRYGGMGFACEA